MSDEATEAAENGPQSSSIQINAQYIKDLSFESPRAPMVLQEQAQPAIEVSVVVKAHRLAEKSFEVVLSASADAKTDSGQVFLVELTYAGVFTLDGVNEQQVAPILLVECPRLLFPFARAIIADATRDGGFPPLMIQPVDFARLFAENQTASA
ncbi:MAG: protein-export chaperone SecB [Pseudomonadota bacterium]|nr:protein-export chaperone SecB [Pseudomonadota bacterium]